MKNSINKTKQNENIKNFANELFLLLNKFDFKINSCHLSSKEDSSNQVLVSIWNNKQNYQTKMIPTNEWLNLND
jgi:hypothetical protein